MQCVILAAGMGTRMGELTKKTPKPLLKIQDLTLLEHNLRALPPEIDEVILVVGYLGEKIKKLIGDEYTPPSPSPSRGGKVKRKFRPLEGGGKEGVRQLKLTYVEQKELKGTAHALSQCKGLLRDRFLVLMGDDLYAKEDLEELLRHELALLAYEVTAETIQDVHALVKRDRQGMLADIIERQKARAGDLANCGAYVLDERFFVLPLKPAGNKTDESGLPQTMLQMVRAGEKFDIVKAQWWHKVATAEDLSSQLPSPT